MIDNYGSLFSAILGIITLITVCYVFHLQVVEFFQPRDKYRRIKVLLMVVSLIFMITMIPVILYQVYRSFGIDIPELRSLATYTGRIGPLAMALSWLMIYKSNKIDN